jgi:hypothetical protein
MTQPPPDDEEPRPDWALRSVFVAVACWVVGRGGFMLWDSRTVARPPLQADLGHDLGLLLTSLLTLLIGPPLGLAFALLGFCKQSAKRGVCLIGLCLSLWVWGSLPFSRFVPTLAGIVLTAAGIAAAVFVGVWMDYGRSVNEPRGFEVKQTADPRGKADHTR